MAAAAGAVALAGTSQAQDLTTDFDASATIAFGAFDAEGRGDPESFGLRARFGGEAFWTTANGIDLGAAIDVAAERDHPGRTPRGGGVGACPVMATPCPVPRGYASGLGFGVPEGGDEFRAGLETAYLFVRGPGGEGGLGRDAGAAARYSLSPPTVLKVSGGADSSIDLSGLGGVFVRNDGSGQSIKATVESPRILGLKGALSFTPDGREYQGLDQGYERSPVVLAFAPDEIWEAGVSFAHALPSGLEAQAGVTFLAASPRVGAAAFEDLETWTIGANIGREGWRIGAAFLDSTDGATAGGYQAFVASWVNEWAPWALMAEFGQADDDTAQVKAHMATMALKRSFGERVSIASGVSYRSRQPQIGTPLSTNEGASQTIGLFWELAFTP
jgi:hypothetical protein